jgi:O-antigen ligase
MAKLLKYGSLFIIVADELKNKKRLKWAVIGIICGLYLCALDGFYSLYFGRDFLRNKPPDFVIGLMRMKAAFPHTNILAGYMALLLPVPIALTLYYLRNKKKVLLGLICALAVYALVLTFSRSAVLGIWLAILFIGIIKKDKLILALLLLSLFIAPFFAPKSIRNWAKATDSPWEFLLNKERFDLYKTALNMVKEHPFIGVGVNTYCLNYQKYKVSQASVLTNKGNWYAHNIFLQMAAEIGIAGLAVFIWLLISLFMSFFVFLKKTDDHFLEVCALGIASGLVAFLVNGITETNLYYPKIAVLFWYQVGLLFGSIKLGGFSWTGSK